MKLSLNLSKCICALLLAIFALGSHGDSAQRINIVASRYSFEPSSISLKKDVPVVLVLRSGDVAHGLQIKELGVNVQVPKGRTVEVPVTPHAVGTFQGKCNRFCGFGHGRMLMTVTVTQ